MSRVPGQQAALEPARRAVREFPQQRVEDDAEYHDVGPQELARIHGQIPDAAGGRDRFGHDER